MSPRLDTACPQGCAQDHLFHNLSTLTASSCQGRGLPGVCLREVTGFLILEPAACFHRGVFSGVSSPWQVPPPNETKPVRASPDVCPFLASGAGRAREPREKQPCHLQEGGHRVEELSLLCSQSQPPHDGLLKELPLGKLGVGRVQGGSLHPGTPGPVPKLPQGPGRCTSAQGKRSGYGSCHLANAMDVSQGDIKWQEGVGREFPGGPAVSRLWAFTAGGRGSIPGCGTKMSQSQKKRVGWRRVTIHRRVTEPQPSTTVLFPTQRMRTSRNMATCPPVCPGCCCSSVAKSCLTLCNPMDCSPPGSSVHGIS